MEGKAKRSSAVSVCLAIALTLTACTEAPSDSIDSEVGAPSFSGIDETEIVTLGGTEPFWSAVIDAEQLTYSTPDNIAGETIQVSRFSGNNGLGYSGTLQGEALEIAVTLGDCSDGMSDRMYPYTATIVLGDRTLFGCGHTDKQPFSGGE
ncbi:MAG: hypothetical protein AAF709_20880 [Pseudomonadota bacterium]